MRLVLRYLLLAVAIGIVAAVVPGIHVYGGFGSWLWIALLFALVNVVAGTLLRLLTLPLIVITLGLFLWLINAAVLGLTAALTSDLAIDSFWDALLGAALMAVLGWLSELLVPLRRSRSRAGVAG